MGGQQQPGPGRQCGRAAGPAVEAEPAGGSAAACAWPHTCATRGRRRGWWCQRRCRRPAVKTRFGMRGAAPAIAVVLVADPTRTSLQHTRVLTGRRGAGVNTQHAVHGCCRTELSAFWCGASTAYERPPYALALTCCCCCCWRRSLPPPALAAPTPSPTTSALICDSSARNSSSSSS